MALIKRLGLSWGFSDNYEYDLESRPGSVSEQIPNVRTVDSEKHALQFHLLIHKSVV